MIPKMVFLKCYLVKGFAPMPPAPLTLEAWWLRGVVAKRRSGLSKPCRNRAGEDAFR